MDTRNRLLLALTISLVACGGGDDNGGETTSSGSAGTDRSGGAGSGVAESSPEDLLMRQRAAAHFAETEAPKAFELMAPLADREDALLDDLVHASSIALDIYVAQVERARGWNERAEAIAPDDLRVLWTKHRLAVLDNDWEASEAMLRRILAARPDDIPTKLALSETIRNSRDDVLDELVPLYEEVLAVGPDFGGSWYRSCAFKMFRLMVENGRTDEARKYDAIVKRLDEQGIKAPTNEQFDVGTFGSFEPPPSAEVYPRDDATDAGAPVWTVASTRSQDDAPAGVRGMSAFAPLVETTAENRTISPGGGNLGWVFSDGLPADELLLWGESGVHVATPGAERWTIASVLDEPAYAAAAFDLGDPDAPVSIEHPKRAGDGDADLVVALAGELVLIERKGDRWERRAEPLFTYATPPTAIVPVDYDHEGDLDLLLVGAGGATLLRNDGAHEPDGGFTDATAESEIPVGRELAWAFVEDLDHDNDVDLVYGGPGGAHHASSERAGVFSDQSAKLPSGLASGASARDVDGDGWPDLVAADGKAWSGGPSGAWRELAPGTSAPGGPFLVAESIDLGGGVPVDLGARPGVVRLEGRTLATQELERAPAGNALQLVLLGEQDNQRGLGAMVEIIVGSAYRRVYWRGDTLFFATSQPTVDVVRVTWPNGVQQNLIDLPADGSYIAKQRPGLQGSCPFLYTWDGERFVFITDVLGITPLGLPMAPGMIVPPDHDEFVLVKGDKMKPKDGEYVIQITEELREVTYLDRVRLDVIDHPADVEIFPNERFSFPPFPEHHVHTLTGALSPETATGSDGHDWTAALRADDEDLAMPFTPLYGRFGGLAEPWFVELSFDADAVRDASKLRLALNGWLFWTNASVNMAAARDPRVEFIPPLLQVPDGEGGWREAGVLGFPAGKLKTMVVDVTDAIPRDDPRIRVFSSLQLYWDSIRLATDADDAPLMTTSIEPTSADLWLRGFSRPLPHPDHPELEAFDWDELDEPRWNQHPGSYTKLGECVELVTAIDDRFCILGAGDALTVRFPADALPPLKDGWTRDYLIFFDGWAKDRDPNTLEALYVEPLPFHGMSSYPYSEDETFPDGAEHREWRRDWNSRSATTWIEALAPRD